MRTPRAAAFILLILAVLMAITFNAFGQGAWDGNNYLGGKPWTSYLRSDVPDTANGMKWFPDSLKLGTYGTGATHLNFLTKCDAYYDQAGYWGQWSFYGGSGLLIGHYSYAPNPSGNALEIVEYDPTGTAVLLTADANLTTGHLLRLTGNSKTGGYDLMKIAEMGAGCHGIGIYTAAPGAIGTYYDVGDSGIGQVVECNYMTDPQSRGISIVSMGLGIPLDIGVDSTFVPAIVIRDSSYGVAQDSSMYYHWGMNTHKVMAETLTVKTPDGLSFPYIWATNDTRIWSDFWGVNSALYIGANGYGINITAVTDTLIIDGGIRSNGLDASMVKTSGDSLAGFFDFTANQRIAKSIPGLTATCIPGGVQDSTLAECLKGLPNNDKISLTTKADSLIAYSTGAVTGRLYYHLIWK